MLRRDYKEVCVQYEKKKDQLQAWIESPASRSGKDLNLSSTFHADPMRVSSHTTSPYHQIVELENQIRELERLNITLTKRAEVVSNATENNFIVSIGDQQNCH